MRLCPGTLAVSFVAPGWWPGIAVAVAIPLVLAITFVAMKLLGFSLQRIALGGLIIALGLLVDDATTERAPSLRGHRDRA